MFREFTVHTPTDTDDGPEFALGERRFRCIPHLPAGVIAQCFFNFPDWAEMEDMSTRSMWMARAIVFIGRCVTSAQAAELDEALLDKTVVVDGQTVIELARWLVEQYTPFDPGRLMPSPNGHGPMSLTGVGSSSATGGGSGTSN